MDNPDPTLIKFPLSDISNRMVACTKPVTLFVISLDTSAFPCMINLLLYSVPIVTLKITHKVRVVPTFYAHLVYTCKGNAREPNPLECARVMDNKQQYEVYRPHCFVG